jgi:ABC-type Fe3+-hydroxamate transport system substrate-binding protein
MRYFSEFIGRYIEVPDRPKRIVSLAPNVTDTLFRLGLGDRVVGVSLYCNRPRNLNLPRVGSYLKVLWDRLEALDPDLVFLTTGAQRKVAEEVLSRGIAAGIVPVPSSTFGILDNVRKVGILTDSLDRAEALNRELLISILSLMEEPLSLRVYYEVDLGGPITAGGPSYITDALHLVGLRNVYAFRKEPYFQPDDGETKGLNFDLILYEPKPERKYDEGKIRDTLIRRLGNRGVVILEGDFLAHYGPSLFDEILPELKRRVREAL